MFSLLNLMAAIIFLVGFALEDFPVAEPLLVALRKLQRAHLLTESSGVAVLLEQVA
jgi:hypothetical protein